MKQTAWRYSVPLCSLPLPRGRCRSEGSRSSGNFFRFRGSRSSRYSAFRAGEEYREERVSEGLKHLLQTKQFSDLQAAIASKNGAAILSLIGRGVSAREGSPRPGQRQAQARGHRGQGGPQGGLLRPPVPLHTGRLRFGLSTARRDTRRRGRSEKDTGRKEHGSSSPTSSTRGEKIKIRHLDFLGNGALETAEIEKPWRARRADGGGEAISNRQRSMTTSGRSRISTAQRLYRRRGAYREDQEEIDGGKSLDLYIRVSEGKPYTLGTPDLDREQGRHRRRDTQVCGF